MALNLTSVIPGGSVFIFREAQLSITILFDLRFLPLVTAFLAPTQEQNEGYEQCILAQRNHAISPTT